MSITSGGKSYNPSFPVANVNNNSKGFRDNFATIKFAIESLQTAQTGGATAGGLTSNGSILKLSASPDTNGAILLKAEFNSTGFRLPVNRPSSTAAGMVCYENGVFYFHNGSTWQNFIERVGDTVTLPKIVATTKLSLNYAPTDPTDAVTVKWVQDYIAALPPTGMDPTIYARLTALEKDVDDEIELRASEDTAIRALITVEKNRIDGHDTQFTQVSQQITQVTNNLNTRMDAVESTAGQTSGDFAALSQSVSNAVAQVNALSQAVDGDLAAETDARIAADNALGARIDTINNTSLPAITASVSAEREARIAADNNLHSRVDATNSAVNVERADRIAQGNVQNNNIAALSDTVSQSNALVLSMDGRLNTVAADILAERNNRIVGDQALTLAVSNEATARAAADTALSDRIDAEVTNRTNADTALGGRIDTEATARQQADQAEVTARNQAIAAAAAAEVTARDGAIQSAVTTERDARTAADAALDARIDALESGSGSNDYLDKSDGGTITGPVTIANTTFTLQNSTLELPGSDIKLDASKALLFAKLPNSTGVGDGGFITFDENNFRYAYLDNGAASGPERSQQVALGAGANEFACLRVGSTNDPTGLVADSVAIEPSAHLYLNPGWTGDAHAEGANRTPATGSFVIVGDALTWKVRISRDTGNILTRGRIDADGDIQGLSDESVKDNVRQITGALDKIEALVGVMYDRNDQDGKASTGLIAQNVKQVMPEVVGQRDDGKLTVAYGNLMGLVVEAIKELRAEVKALKS